MKQNKLLLVIEGLEARLLKSISNKNNMDMQLNKLNKIENLSSKEIKAFREYLAQFATKDDIEEIEHKFNEKLQILELELYSMKTQMISKKDLEKYEAKMKRKFVIYTVYQISISILFLILFWTI